MVGLDTIRLLLPELILVLAAAYIYVVGTALRSRTWWSLFALVTYTIVAWTLWRHESLLWEQLAAGHSMAVSGPLAVDMLGQIVRWLALLVGVLFTLVAAHSAPSRLASEYLGTLMLLVAGVMLVGRANELVLLFVALELISIPTYVLLFLGRQRRATMEATGKYFFLSILSSALFLYGISFFYGLAGSTVLVGTAESPGIREALAGGQGPLAAIGLVLIVAGLGFRLAAVPFQFYAPDVYQGSTNANAGLLAVAPKVAGVVALIRLLAGSWPSSSPFAWQLMFILALLTMTVGNTCALWQTNVRRLLAYSSIAHAGYMLIGLTVGLAAGDSLEYGGIAGMLFYLLVYSLASLGTFAALAAISTEQREVGELSELAGMGRRRPVWAAAVAVFMFSLAGIPPLAGFWGKLAVFGSAVDAATAETVAGSTTLDGWLLALAIAGVLNAAVAAAYYLRVVAVMYFHTAASSGEETKPAWGPWAATIACAWLVVALGLMPGEAIRGAQLAEQSVFARDIAPLAALGEPDTESGSKPGSKPGSELVTSGSNRRAAPESSEATSPAASIRAGSATANPAGTSSASQRRTTAMAPAELAEGTAGGVARRRP